MQLVRSFEFALNDRVLPQMAVVGCFDGVTPVLAVATSASSLVLYTPSAQDPALITRRLNLPAAVTALAVGTLPASLAALDAAGDPLLPDLSASTDNSTSATAAAAVATAVPRDYLLCGSAEHLHAFDVEANRTLYTAPLPDGATRLAFAPLLKPAEPLAIAGGNCSLHGYAAPDGAEAYWSVCGDTVSCMAARPLPALAPLITASSATTGAAGAVGAVGAQSPSALCELLVGADDYAIRVYRGVDIVAEHHESDVPTHLVPLPFPSLASPTGSPTAPVSASAAAAAAAAAAANTTGAMGFAFALAGGVVGAYTPAGDKAWSVRARDSVVALLVLPPPPPAAPGLPAAAGAATAALVVVWDCGRVEARDTRTGMLLCQATVEGPVVAAVAGPFAPAPAALAATAAPSAAAGAACAGMAVMVCSAAGAVTALTLADASSAAAGAATVAAVGEGEVDAGAAAARARELRLLLDEKLALLRELREIEVAISATGSNGNNSNSGSKVKGAETTELSVRADAAGAGGAGTDAEGNAAQPLIPPHTKLVLELVPQLSAGGLELRLGVNNNAIIKALAITSTALFHGHTRLIVPDRPVPVVSVPVPVDRNVAADVTLRCVVGLRGADGDHVFEVPRTLPRYARYFPAPFAPAMALPAGLVALRVRGEHANRLLLWVRQAFHLDDATVVANALAVDATDRAFRLADLSGGGGVTGETAAVVAVALYSLHNQTPVVVAMGRETIAIACDDAEFAGELVQDIGDWFGLGATHAACAFPQETEKIGAIMATIKGLTATRYARICIHATHNCYWILISLFLYSTTCFVLYASHFVFCLHLRLIVLSLQCAHDRGQR